MTTSQGNTLEKTEVLYGLDDIMKKSIQFLSQAHKIDLCGDNRSANAILDIEEYKKILSEVKSKGIETRYVTEINKDNINNCKQLMDFVGEVRHLDGIRANFSISETEYLASIAEIQTAKLVPHIIYSNVKYIVEQQKYVFESFWNKAIPAEQRIREIEEGIESEFFEVIAERKKISQIFLDLVRSVKKEALILFPNDKAMVRAYRLGIIDYLVKVSQKENGVSTKIICPLSKENYSIVKKISEQAPSVRILNGNDSLYGMYILDSEKLLRVEMREPKAETFIEAIGFAMYSNRKNTVESFRSVFELIWNEHVLNEELKKTYERQEEFIKMQQEFLNIASHEMKTPTQAILAISRLLQKHPERKDEFIQAISRNAVRLQRLTNDILDVTRIESQTLKLKKERFDLNDIILNIVQDYRNQLEKDKDKRNVKLLLFYDQEFNKNNNYNDDKSPIFIEADRERIGQVISNLLSNAIKFSKKMAEDYISIATIPSNEGDQVIVSVKDTGIGIDSQILPRLFEKFVTKSDAGTGLGLFISKSIVEAHGGRIWAENNKDGGATFYFSLPLKKTRAQSSNNNEQ